MIRKALIIGQAPPEKNYQLPFGGTRLYKWLNQVGFPEEAVLARFSFDALVDAFPGKSDNGHKPPDGIAIQEHIPRLLKKIKSNQVDVIIPVGKMAIQYVLNSENINLSEVIGKKFRLKPFGKSGRESVIIPLPHPSGASTWVHSTVNKKLLTEALLLIKTSLKPD